MGQAPRLRLVMDALAARRGGTAYAAVALARHLAAEPAVGQVIVIARRQSIVATGLQSSETLNVEVLASAGALELPRRLMWEALRLPRLLRATQADHLISWSGMLPRSMPVPVISHVSNPVMFELDGGADPVRRWAMARTLGRCSKVIAPTQAMAKLIEAHFGLTPQVVPYGIDSARFSPAQEPGSGVIAVADFYPHKRHDLLLDAWAMLRAPRPPLTLIGEPDVNPAWHQRIVHHARALAHLGRINLESELSLAELIGAYRAASVFVLASESESFSLPLLEAQACGLVTVVRDLPALHETGGPSTVFVRGEDTDAWSRAVQGALAGPQTEARRLARQHAVGFTWDKTAAAFRDSALATRG